MSNRFTQAIKLENNGMIVALEVPITSCSDPHWYFVLLTLNDMLMSVVSISLREIKPFWNDDSPMIVARKVYLFHCHIVEFPN